MLHEILFALWFFLPVGIGNCAPIFAKALPGLKQWSYPLDCYLTFGGKRIFGDHKTVRGLVVGIITSIVVVYVQQYFYETSLNPLVFGFLAGFGAIGGDSVKSFFKRQRGIAEGRRWFPFDQLDYIFGAIATTFFYVRLSFFDYVVIVFVWFFLHLVFSALGFLVGLKPRPL